jgi:kinetochore protein NDC80
MTQNDFEAEMKHDLSQNALKSPTQKDFNYMFQWLYHRIDPHHRFQKGIDQELPLILKQLRYPFEKGITKSGIAAAGGHNWGAFLGVLHWMMQLSRMLDGYAQGQYDGACGQIGIDTSRDRIVFSFLSGAYRDWLDMDEEASDEDVERVLEPHVSAMTAAFAQSCSRFAAELEVLESENARLRKAIEDMQKATTDPAVIDSHFKIMEEDRGKFLTYIKQAEQRSERYEKRNQVLEEELEKLGEELKEAEDERYVMLRSLDAQGISMRSIDWMNSERDRLQQRIESASGKLAAGKEHLTEKEAEARRKLVELKRAVEKFNELAYRSALIPATATNAKGQNYELEVTADDELGSAKPDPFKTEGQPGSSIAGHQPGRILNLDLRGRVRGALLSLRREISDRRGAAMEDMMRDHELLDGIKEAIADRHSENDALQHRVHAAELECEKTKEITQAQKMFSDTQIEKMEAELSRMRSGLAEVVRVLEQREISTTME